MLPYFFNGNHLVASQCDIHHLLGSVVAVREEEEEEEKEGAGCYSLTILLLGATHRRLYLKTRQRKAGLNYGLELHVLSGFHSHRDSNVCNVHTTKATNQTTINVHCSLFHLV